MFDNINEICGKNLNDGEKDFNFYCVGNSAFAFEGKYRIEHFDNELIVLNVFKSRFIKIMGENLSIGTLAPKEIGISGKILSILFEGRF